MERAKCSERQLLLLLSSRKLQESLQNYIEFPISEVLKTDKFHDFLRISRRLVFTRRWILGNAKHSEFLS